MLEKAEKFFRRCIGGQIGAHRKWNRQCCSRHKNNHNDHVAWCDISNIRLKTESSLKMVKQVKRNHLFGIIAFHETTST